MQILKFLSFLLIIVISKQKDISLHQKPKVYHRKSTIKNSKCDYILKLKLEKRISNSKNSINQFIFQNNFKFKEKIIDSHYNIISEKISFKKVMFYDSNIFNYKKNFIYHYMNFNFLLDGKKDVESIKRMFFNEYDYHKIERSNFACDSQLPALNYKNIEIKSLPEEINGNYNFNLTTIFNFDITDFPKTHLKYDLEELKQYLSDKREIFSKFKNSECNISKVIN